jgi:hypothetical protein
MSNSSLLTPLDFCNAVKDGFEDRVLNPPTVHGRKRHIVKHDGYMIPLEEEDFTLEIKEMSKDEVIKKIQTGEFRLGLCWNSHHSVKGGTCFIINVMNGDKEVSTIFMPMNMQIIKTISLFHLDIAGQRWRFMEIITVISISVTMIVNFLSTI